MIPRFCGRSIKTALARPRCFSTSYRTLAPSPFKILFCGSDQFSLGSLQAVLDASDTRQSIHVITPDPHKIGRGGRNAKKVREVLKCDLHTFAEERGIHHSTLADIVSIDDRANKDAAWKAPAPFDHFDENSLLLTASFGHIIPNNLLDKFSPGHRLNVHPSLLPKYRGAAPVQWTIMNGDERTGITVQRLVERGKGIDAGEIVGSVADLPVRSDATFSGMIADLAPIGGELLVKCMREILAGKGVARSQDPTMKTRAPKITKDTSRIDWSVHSAATIDRKHRAIGHQYPVWCESRGQPVQLLDVRLCPRDEAETIFAARSASAMAFGTAVLDKKASRMLVACPPVDSPSSTGSGEQDGYSWLDVRTIKPEGKKDMNVKEWWNGLSDLERKRGWVQL